jgi:hypothetical protein
LRRVGSDTNLELTYPRPEASSFLFIQKMGYKLIVNEIKIDNTFKNFNMIKFWELFMNVFLSHAHMSLHLKKKSLHSRKVKKYVK